MPETSNGTANGNGYGLTHEEVEELKRRAQAAGMTLEEFIARVIRDSLDEDAT